MIIACVVYLPTYFILDLCICNIWDNSSKSVGCIMCTLESASIRPSIMLLQFGRKKVFSEDDLERPRFYNISTNFERLYSMTPELTCIKYTYLCFCWSHFLINRHEFSRLSRCCQIMRELLRHSQARQDLTEPAQNCLLNTLAASQHKYIYD